MDITLVPLPRPAAPDGPLEIVERKGRGHPDTLCDAVAEAFSEALCRFYREHVGAVLHHNVDKVLLVGGSARPAFGGGELLAPLHVHLAGRATARAGEVDVPLWELARDATHGALGHAVPSLDLARDVVVHVHVRPGSVDLAALFAKGGQAGAPLSNDTSLGVGHAPLSPLERAVLAAEDALQQARSSHPALGPDVKIMGVRRGRRVDLTVGCALVGRHLADLEAYLAARELARGLVAAAAARALGPAAEVGEVVVNAADDPSTGSLYLTVTGCSAEAGDDGEAGRGNRACGLITPHRPMTLESVAGKNPVSHVGKLYNLLAPRLAADLVARLPGVAAAQVALVSRIGAPVDQPASVEAALGADAGSVAAMQGQAEAVVGEHLARLARECAALVTPPGHRAPAR